MKLLIVALLSLPLLSFAKTTIKITSFERADNRNTSNTTGEVCGIVSSDSEVISQLLVISDPGRNEGHYVANVTPQGRFCHVIRTLQGQVSVTLLSPRTPGPRVSETLKKEL